MNETQVMIDFKLAVRDFLLRRHPEAVDKLELLSLRFSMSRDIGENRYNEALRQLHTWSQEVQLRQRQSVVARESTVANRIETLDKSLLRVDDLFLVIQVREHEIC